MATSPPSSSARKLASGSLWTTISEVFGGLATLATSIVAARVLAPEDFGHMAIIYLTIGILEAFSQTGFERALVQRQDDVDSLLNVAWSWQLGRGATIALLMALAAPWMGQFYGESILVPALAVCALYLIFEGARNIGVVFFSRQLDFKTLCMINVVKATLKLGVAIPAILIFRNVWALVIEFILGALIGLIISYVAHPYRPRLEWDWAKAKQLIRFGKWITGLTIIGFFITRGDDLFVSKYLGTAALGYYFYAYEISNLPATKITHVLGRVSFPTYSRLQGDKAELRRAFVGVMKTTMMITAPLSVAIWQWSPYLIAYVIGDKWERILPLIHILVMAGLLRSFNALAGALFQACNRPDLDFKMNMSRLLVTAVLIWPFASRWDLEGVSVVIGLAVLSTMPVWFYGVRYLLNLGFVEVLRANVLAAVSALFLAGCLTVANAVIYTLVDGPAGAVLAMTGGLMMWLAAMAVLHVLTPLKLFAEIRNLRAAFTK